MRMTWWDSEARTWRWSVVDRAGKSRRGTAATQALAESEARMNSQMRDGEPDRHVFAPWRTHRWSRTEQRMIPNVRPRPMPRLATPPQD
ncbi:hypothetical protein GCM10009613_11670 [Pseudonocardia kongjuensis]|uniref:DUF1508 domain-containing protein n=1 Tax=Pseudonocardia kongjuensis TaxID=102227 RepID=A0ABN1XIZ7_9PSEU